MSLICDSTPAKLHIHRPGSALGSCCGGSGVRSLLPSHSEVADASFALPFSDPLHIHSFCLYHKPLYGFTPFSRCSPHVLSRRVPPLSPLLPCPRFACPRSPPRSRTPSAVAPSTLALPRLLPLLPCQSLLAALSSQTPLTLLSFLFSALYFALSCI